MLTADNALWCAIVLAIIAAVCTIALYAGRERPTDWTAPCTDTPDPDDHACDIPPVVWSGGRYVCAVEADDLPNGICGWPVTDDRDCPAHGTRAPVLPGGAR